MPKKLSLGKLIPKVYVPKVSFVFIMFSILIIGGILVAAFSSTNWNKEKNALTLQNEQAQKIIDELSTKIDSISTQLSQAQLELETLRNEDQFQKNIKLQNDIKSIETTYTQTVTEYEALLDLRGDGAKVDKLEPQFGQILGLLAKRNYASASVSLQKLRTDIQTTRAQLAAAEPPVPSNIPTSNSAPASGYARQAVETEVGRFQVDILSADLGSTKVVVETASAGDCLDNCPVSSLADYVSRAGGYAGINGPYFCPADYPSCAGKTNSFDTLIMNKNKVYFNSENNVYSTVPAFIFSGGARLVGRSSDWGRDTGPDSVIASQPMLLSGGNITFGGDGDPKKGSRGSRSFIGSKDNTVYIGVVRGATVAEVAYVLKTLGIQNALNLDSGGSTAFYTNGRYVAGPGRATPFGIVLVRR